MAKFCLILVITVAGFGQLIQADEKQDVVTLKSLLDATQKELKLVAVGGLMQVDGKTVAIRAVGKRKQGSDVAVSVKDKWHLGSITKSMTATVIGRLVDRGVLDWDTLISDLSPELMKDADEGWKNLTLQHLLTHRSGLPANFGFVVMLEWPKEYSERHQMRREALQALLKAAPKTVPGETELYSNVGYTMAGYIAAEKVGSTWEDLMQRELFEPMQLTSAGFGPPRGENPVDQPWGHKTVLIARRAMDPTGFADNTPIIGPAGIVHMTLQDLAKYATAHLQKSDYLKPATWKHLHTPTESGYACGWGFPDGPDGSFWHNGSNTMWYALLNIDPKKQTVIALTTNDGSVREVRKRFRQIVNRLNESVKDD